MATTAGQDASAKQRIIRHMNADHQDSVRRYVEHQEATTFLQVRDAQMTDINLNWMKISYGGTQAVVPFEPPMKTMREARERLVQMDKDALKALGRSDISVTEYIPPSVHPGHLFNFSQCLITYLAFACRSNFQPGSLLFDNVLFRFPGFAELCYSIQPYLLSIMVAIHAFETSIMVKKLRRHGLTPLDKAFWLWTGSCFIEGVTSFWRLGAMVDKKRKEKEAKKH